MTDCEYSISVEHNKEIWESYFKQSYFSNLLQSWNYGEAKATLEGWIVRRGVIIEGNIPVALCQWMEKSILKLWRVVRINRGPIWLCGQPDFHEKLSLYHFLRKYFGVFRGNFLFIAPALYDNEENKLMLKNLGYKKRTKLFSWKSALVHLEKSEIELRASLQSRLRNYLKRAENNNLTFETSTSKTDFLDLIARYNQLQKEKNFVGVAANCIELLYDFDNQNGHAFMARVKNVNGELMAEKFLFIHGNQCTPLIAWTSTEGSKSHAMHLLMWKIMLDLKARGIMYFDVGGYNEKERPSVCQFKKGFGGEEYCLVGEYRGFL